MSTAVCTYICKYFPLFTAGLPDMAMSALVKEQIEGISSEAISIIPPDKFAVSHFAVFSRHFLSCFVWTLWDFLNPTAVSAVLPLQVVFDQTQISMFSYEQAAAVTDEQLSALSDVQRTALAMVLTPWEDRPVDFRGELFPPWRLIGCSLYLLRFPHKVFLFKNELNGSVKCTILFK